MLHFKPSGKPTQHCPYTEKFFLNEDQSQGDNTTKYDTQPFSYNFPLLSQFSFSTFFFSSTFECFFRIWDSWHFSMKAGLDLPSQSANLGPPHSCLLWGANLGEETQQLGCFQCDFNSCSLSLAARMYFIQQWLLMQPLLIFLSRYIVYIKLPFSCFQPMSAQSTAPLPYILHFPS